MAKASPRADQLAEIGLLSEANMRQFMPRHRAQFLAIFMVCLALALHYHSVDAQTGVRREPIAYLAEGLRWRCDGVDAVVHSSSMVEASTACDGAAAAQQLLADCGVSAKREITIDVSDSILIESHGKKAGDYMPGSARARVMSFVTYGQHTKPAHGELHLTFSDHFRGLVAHEVTHALIDQDERSGELTETAQEYLAYAVQISTYPPAARAKIIGLATLPKVSHLFHFTPFLLYADPHRFGTVAFAHFSRPENGCAFVQQVLNREVHFPPGSD